jgi:tetratricopeptide (TPR) repeat protein
MNPVSLNMNYLEMVIPANIKSQKGQLATYFNEIGLKQLQSDDAKHAYQSFKQALALDQEIYSPECHESIARDYNNLGVASQELKQFEDAIACHKQSLEINKKIYGDPHPEIATDLTHLGNSLQKIGKFDEAEVCLENALTINRQFYDRNDPMIAINCGDLGLLLQKLKRYKEAIQYFKESLSIIEKCSTDNYIAIYCNHLGKALRENGNLAEAESYMRKAYDLDKKSLEVKDSDKAWHCYNLGLVLLDKYQYRESVPFFQEALKICLEGSNSQYPLVSFCRSNILQALFKVNYPSTESYSR